MSGSGLGRYLRVQPRLREKKIQPGAQDVFDGGPAGDYRSFGSRTEYDNTIWCPETLNLHKYFMFCAFHSCPMLYPKTLQR